MKKRSVKTMDNRSGLFKQSLKSSYGLFVFQRCLTFDGVYAALWEGKIYTVLSLKQPCVHVLGE